MADNDCTGKFPSGYDKMRGEKVVNGVTYKYYPFAESAANTLEGPWNWLDCEGKTMAERKTFDVVAVTERAARQRVRIKV